MPDQANLEQLESSQNFSHALKWLSAKQVADDRFAYAAAGRWCVTSREDLERFNEGYEGEWVADNGAVEMPIWWMPERRYAYRCVDCGHLNTRPYACRSAIPHTDYCDKCRVHRPPAYVTADLETGAEIAA